MKKQRNIRRLRPNLWQGRKVVNGKRISVYGRTASEAALKLKLLLSDCDNALLKPKRIRYKAYGEWLNEWFELYKRPRLKEASLYQIDVCMRLHIPSWIKAKPIAELTVPDVDKALLSVSSSRMREYTHDVYCESLRKAYELNLCARPLHEFIAPVQHERVSGRALTLGEQRSFFQRIAGHRFEKLFAFYLLTGVRRSEALALKISDVDFEHGELHVLGTKTKHSDRYIPLFPAVRQLLLSIEPVNGLYFPFKSNYVTKAFHNLFPNLTLKDLRHTFGTRCFQCGIPELVYKRWLGHSPGSKVTLEVYTHVDDVQKLEAARFTLTPKTDECITKPAESDSTGNGSPGRI